MANKEIRNQATGVTSPDGKVGLHVEQRLTYNDHFLPSAEEMKAYNEVDPTICKRILDAFEREQTMRHEIAKQNMTLKETDSRRAYRLSWGGMCAALLSVFATLGVAAYALYIGNPWIAGLLGGLGIATIVGMFLRKGERQ